MSLLGTYLGIQLINGRLKDATSNMNNIVDKINNKEKEDNGQ